MTLHVNDAGIWKGPTPYVNDGGVWKLAEVWVNDAGVWKLVSGVQVLISDAGLSASDPVTNDGCSATFSVKSNGYVEEADSEGASAETEQWLQSGAVGDYEIHATWSGHAGGVLSGSTGSWLPLSTTRSWSLTVGPTSTGTATLTLKVRRVSDSVEIDTATITFSVSSGV
jgi:hypothetical protein